MFQQMDNMMQDFHRAFAAPFPSITFDQSRTNQSRNQGQLMRHPMSRNAIQDPFAGMLNGFSNMQSMMQRMVNLKLILEMIDVYTRKLLINHELRCLFFCLKNMLFI